MQNRNVRLILTISLPAFSQFNQTNSYSSILDFDNINLSGSFHNRSCFFSDNFSVLKPKGIYTLPIYFMQHADYIQSFVLDLYAYVESPQSLASPQASSASLQSVFPLLALAKSFMDFFWALNSLRILLPYLQPETIAHSMVFPKSKFKKEEELDPKTPHYMLLINLIQSKNCNMITNDG